MKSIASLLLSLYKKKRLSPFYIIRPALTGPSPSLLEWAHDFSTQVITFQKKISPEQAKKERELGHRDLFFIGETIHAKRPYKVDDEEMNLFFEQQRYGPLELSQKLIFVHEAQFIGDYFSHKWLKSLEEPHERITTFFLVSNQRPLLKTIQSRALEFRLRPSAPPPQPKGTTREREDFKTFLKREIQGKNFPQSSLKKLNDFCTLPGREHLFIEIVRESPQIREDLFHIMSDYISPPHQDLFKQIHWLNEIQWFSKAEKFNNNKTERFYGLLESLRESKNTTQNHEIEKKES